MLDLDNIHWDNKPPKIFHIIKHKLQKRYNHFPCRVGTAHPT